MLRKVRIQNYRVFKDFKLEFSPGVNILVGNNDAGKSTLLEAINLALTARLHGNPISTELSPHLFNQKTTPQYVRDLQSGKRPVPPEIVIELYLDNTPQHAILVGGNNLLGEDCPGVRLKIVLDEDLVTATTPTSRIRTKVNLVPTEYYSIEWLDFAGNPIKNTQNLPDASLIDASTIRLQSGTDYYMQQIIAGTSSQPSASSCPGRTVACARRSPTSMHRSINTKLAEDQGDISRRQLSLSIDISSARRLGTQPGPASR